MELQPVVSSNIRGIAHDAATATLWVKFAATMPQDEKIYEYHGVSAELFDKFQAAESKGKFFHQEIKPKFTGTLYVSPLREPVAEQAQANQQEAASEENAALADEATQKVEDAADAVRAGP